jgi:hypothetical protein
MSAARRHTSRSSALSDRDRGFVRRRRVTTHRGLRRSSGTGSARVRDHVLSVRDRVMPGKRLHPDTAPHGLRDHGVSGAHGEYPFLASEEEARQFRERYPRYPRVLRQIRERIVGVEGSDRKDARTIEGTVDLALLKLRNRGGGSLAFTIGVWEHDGRSWSATAAEQAARHSQAALPCIALTRTEDPDGLPAIEKLIGRREVLRLAQQYKVTSSFAILRRRVTAAVVFCAFLIAVATYRRERAPERRVQGQDYRE